jgi:hypothetical protein
MKSLVHQGNDEADAFLNFTHLQKHVVVQGIAQIRRAIEDGKIKHKSLNNFIMPLISAMLVNSDEVCILILYSLTFFIA